jgi:DNA-binding NarL/FixJ family response regulator
MKRLIRVLLIDDHAPIRDFLRTTLQQSREFDIVGEASDGLDAIEKFQNLDPDLILLDIGLPAMNGIEVTRGIRSLSPRAKVLIVSENLSWDIAKEALCSGASGYVVKSDAAMELLPAVKSVLQGKQFVSTSLAGHNLSESSETRNERQNPSMDKAASKQGNRAPRSRHHDAGFFSDDRRLIEDVARFVVDALKAGNAAIVIATEAHRNQLLAALWAGNVDFDAAVQQGRYIALDASHTLARLMANGMIDFGRCRKTFGSVILQAVQSAKKRTARVAVFGECVQLLLARGNVDAAIQMERFGNELTEKYDIDILCGYSLHGLSDVMDGLIYEQICAEHSMVYSR